MKVGDVVVAKYQVSEFGFRDEERFVHAEPGGKGRVVDVFPDGWVMVAWEDSSAMCRTDEITPFAASSAPALGPRAAQAS